MYLFPLVSIFHPSKLRFSLFLQSSDLRVKTNRFFMDLDIPNARRRRFRHGRQEIWQQKKLQQLIQFLNEKSTKKPTPKIYSKSGAKSELTQPYDLLFNIFVLLPAESLCKLQFVCKEWFNLINSSIFIEFHKQQSQTVLASKVLLVDKFFRPLIGNSKPKPHFHFVNFDHGRDNFVESIVPNMVTIVASYDGLILGSTDKEKSLILMNPVTRKNTKIPSGTIGFDESYGLVFCSKERTYMVVHLFREPSKYTGCEILNVDTRKWTIMDGPSSNLLEDIKLTPVSVGESLYWMPRKHGCDHILILNVEDAKFFIRKLPIVCTLYDRLVEIGGVLGFVTHAQLNLMQVWMWVKGSGDGTVNWVKRYSIYLWFDARLVVPICSSRNGRVMVFEYPGNDLYVYDFETDDMKMMYSRDDEEMEERVGAEKLLIPHKCTLVSWNHHYSS